MLSFLVVNTYFIVRTKFILFRYNVVTLFKNIDILIKEEWLLVETLPCTWTLSSQSTPQMDLQTNFFRGCIFYLQTHSLAPQAPPLKLRLTLFPKPLQTSWLIHNNKKCNFLQKNLSESLADRRVQQGRTKILFRGEENRNQQKKRTNSE